MIQFNLLSLCVWCCICLCCISPFIKKITERFAVVGPKSHIEAGTYSHLINTISKLETKLDQSQRSAKQSMHSLQKLQHTIRPDAPTIRDYPATIRSFPNKLKGVMGTGDNSLVPFKQIGNVFNEKVKFPLFYRGGMNTNQYYVQFQENQIPLDVSSVLSNGDIVHVPRLGIFQIALA